MIINNAIIVGNVEISGAINVDFVDSDLTQRYQFMMGPVLVYTKPLSLLRNI